MKTLIFSLNVAVLVSLAGPETAHAVFLPEWTGNSWFDTDPGDIGPPADNVEGWVSYAVWQNTPGSNWMTDLSAAAIGLPAAPSAHPFLPPDPTGFEDLAFFYQVTIAKGAFDTASIDPLNPLNAAMNARSWTSSAIYDGIVFSESAVAGPGSSVGDGTPGSTSALGPEASAGTPLATGYAGSVTFFSGGPGTHPTAGGLSAKATISPQFGFAPAVLEDFTTPLLVLTSSGTPFMGEGVLFKAGLPIAVPVPLANPEPGSMLLMSIGIVGGAWIRRRRRNVCASKDLSG